jgi:hypothetical protein
MTDPVAARAAELRARVEERLHPGERFGHAIWVSRAPGRPSVGQIAADNLHPARLAEALAWEAIGVDEAATGSDPHRGDRRGVLGGPSGGAAGGLDAALPGSTIAVVLAVTDRRLVVLHKPPSPQPPAGFRSMLARARREVADLVRNQPTPEPVPPLRPVWEVGRGALAEGHADGGNRLGLRFTDGSWVIVVTPAQLAQAFAAAI